MEQNRNFFWRKWQKRRVLQCWRWTGYQESTRHSTAGLSRLLVQVNDRNVRPPISYGLISINKCWRALFFISADLNLMDQILSQFNEKCQGIEYKITFNRTLLFNRKNKIQQLIVNSPYKLVQKICHFLSIDILCDPWLLLDLQWFFDILIR